MARLEAMYASLDVAAIGRLEAKLTSLRTDFLSELGSRSADITGKVVALRTDVTAIRDDIAVNMGAADAMQRANDNTRELVRLQGDQLSIMWKQIKTLEARVRDLTGDP